MTFPIHLESGFIFDLRYIPFITLALYLGYKNAFLLYIVLNIYRFIIGGEGVIQSFLFSTVILVLVSIFSRYFKQLNSRKRIYCAVFVSFLETMIYLSTLSLQTPLNKEFWTLSIYGLTTNTVMMLIIMILIEQMMSNIKARETYLQSERLHVISELSASVAHEIRNPLTATNGFLQLLSKSKTITAAEKSYIEYSLQELNRAEKIVSDFLAFSKPQCENMVCDNLKEEIDYAKNILLPYAHMHHVEINLSFTNSLNTNYDKNQIQQCLINLYKNGIEAMKEVGGTLYIDVFDQKNNIYIKIKDTGIGMTDEEISRLGKPYYSTKKQGTGLGMLMVYSTIHKVKGHIEVESEKGKGTTFTIAIPA
jgi:two-component system, sporulation sensor kinase B